MHHLKLFAERNMMPKGNRMWAVKVFSELPRCPPALSAASRPFKKWFDRHRGHAPTVMSEMLTSLGRERVQPANTGVDGEGRRIIVANMPAAIAMPPPAENAHV